MDLFFAGVIVASTILSNMDNRGVVARRERSVSVVIAITRTLMAGRTTIIKSYFSKQECSLNENVPFLCKKRGSHKTVSQIYGRKIHEYYKSVCPTI